MIGRFIIFALFLLLGISPAIAVPLRELGLSLPRPTISNKVIKVTRPTISNTNLKVTRPNPGPRKDLFSAVSRTDLSCCTKAIKTGQHGVGCDIDKCLEAYSSFRGKHGKKPFLESDLLKEAQKFFLEAGSIEGPR
ncbi:hypothetical protein TWF694_008782 [Orbilia ellipsospora]|uniref:Uncharacterized protein n=1 Tax=Orbilia ellipsospora TaxID=2528407 RepID=A0AAV9XCX8_9PEZI